MKSASLTKAQLTKGKSLTKSQLINKLTEHIYPNEPIKQDLVRIQLEKCGYKKVELLNFARELI